MSAIARYELEGTVATIHLDDGKANALSEAMLTEMGDALTRAETEAKAVVLAGRPGRFSAGFDLKVMMSGPANAEKLLRVGSAFLMRVYGMPLPVVMACTGHAVAGGALLLLTGDVRIGVEAAYRIGLNEVAIGLPVPVLAMELARDRLLPTELAHATLEAQLYEPAAAARAGYLDLVVPEAELLARAKAEALRLGGLSASAFRATKERLRGKTIAHVTATLDEDMKSLMAGLG